MRGVGRRRAGSASREGLGDDPSAPPTGLSTAALADSRGHPGCGRVQGRSRANRQERQDQRGRVGRRVWIGGSLPRAGIDPELACARESNLGVPEVRASGGPPHDASRRAWDPPTGSARPRRSTTPAPTVRAVPPPPPDGLVDEQGQPYDAYLDPRLRQPKELARTADGSDGVDLAQADPAHIPRGTLNMGDVRTSGWPRHTTLRVVMGHPYGPRPCVRHTGYACRISARDTWSARRDLLHGCGARRTQAAWRPVSGGGRRARPRRPRSGLPAPCPPTRRCRRRRRRGS